MLVLKEKHPLSPESLYPSSFVGTSPPSPPPTLPWAALSFKGSRRMWMVFQALR